MTVNMLVSLQERYLATHLVVVHIHEAGMVSGDFLVTAFRKLFCVCPCLAKPSAVLLLLNDHAQR